MKRRIICVLSVAALIGEIVGLYVDAPIWLIALFGGTAFAACYFLCNGGDEFND